ncbi:MAG: MFS transporter [Sporichthyaceae bacterium]
MTANRWAVLLVCCLGAFTVNVATMIVNILLPSLTRDLDASTRDLLWIVDAFNLVFAALVLACGSLSDRFGRKGALVAGLSIYLVASLLSAYANSANELILWRAVAGLGAAVVFPTTLSIISNVFPERGERAKAIGIWGAATGGAVAIGPIVGGALSEASAWGAAFLFCAAVALLTLILAVIFVPTSRDPETPPLDYLGLLLSIAALGLIVYTIIEASERGWGSTETLADFGAGALLLAAFAWWESRREHPMLDVRLFKNLRFTAASGAVTLSFFALFGFIFLITQYSQFILGWGVLEAGLRQIPVAVAVAITSLAGTALAVRFGTKLVVAAGLLLMGGGFIWISADDANTTYTVIVCQMIIIGSGLGLTSAPATEAIMGVVPAAKAGIGSAVNDATRELGGTLGVAVIGSVSVSMYRETLADGISDPATLAAAQESLGGAAMTAARTGDVSVLTIAQQGFLDGLFVGCLVAAAVCMFGAVLALVYLPAHPVAEVPADNLPGFGHPAAPSASMAALSPPPCSECGHQGDPVPLDERWRTTKKARRREGAPVG